MPELISGVVVFVGNTFNVGVADGGNQMMVAVGGGVFEGVGVSVGGVESTGRQADGMRNPSNRKGRINRFMK
jgi:hypothetical protein